MSVGGNESLQMFFERFNLNKPNPGESMLIYIRYRTNAAGYYRRKLLAMIN